MPARILIVDDHEDTNRSLVILLSRRGYTVKSASSIAEAVEVARAYPIDVLIADIALPDGEGVELLARLSASPPACGGIIVSGYNRDEELERTRAAGFKEHFSKPVDLEKLDRAIQRLLAKG